jgi:hypothetical protein
MILLQRGPPRKEHGRSLGSRPVILWVFGEWKVAGDEMARFDFG